jgi:predicted nucleic-acid-binding Zn-ribbon protein
MKITFAYSEMSVTCIKCRNDEHGDNELHNDNVSLKC